LRKVSECGIILLRPERSGRTPKGGETFGSFLKRVRFWFKLKFEFTCRFNDKRRRFRFTLSRRNLPWSELRAAQAVRTSEGRRAVGTFQGPRPMSRTLESGAPKQPKVFWFFFSKKNTLSFFWEEQ
jgi:hypothetical protein